MSDPGQVLVNDTSRQGRKSDEGASVSLRVYAANALVSPGTLYKAVVATPSTTAVDVSLGLSSAVGRVGVNKGTAGWLGRASPAPRPAAAPSPLRMMSTF